MPTEMITVKCPECGAKGKAKEATFRKSGLCPKCGSKMEIYPDEREPSSDPEPATESEKKDYKPVDSNSLRKALEKRSHSPQSSEPDEEFEPDEELEMDMEEYYESDTEPYSLNKHPDKIARGIGDLQSLSSAIWVAIALFQFFLAFLFFKTNTLLALILAVVAIVNILSANRGFKLAQKIRNREFYVVEHFIGNLRRILFGIIWNSIFGIIVGGIAEGIVFYIRKQVLDYHEIFDKD